ncbi:site-specific DNA-methyltransferase [Candidatus Parcubacteria bacterium]|nr:MAG: site-specific DNA-methyltransferase [Candidatus Parcubacteria bacterium]
MSLFGPMELPFTNNNGSNDIAQRLRRTLEQNAKKIEWHFGKPWYIGEFWTARQRQAKRLHEVSYRACFKPQLPHFFISLLTKPGDTVYDPFAGRGTTVIEAALMGRRPFANDINPLSAILTLPRLDPPSMAEIRTRLGEIKWTGVGNLADIEMDLSMFYHPKTLIEILALRHWLNNRRAARQEDRVDRWIRMVATNRLTGHSNGFFSVYTLPPNQAIMPEEQKKINEKRGQAPDYRNVAERILRKSRSLLSGLTSTDIKNLRAAANGVRFECKDAADPSFPPDATIDLTVTSPPFLNVVDYVRDNWLRCWFNGIDPQEVAQKITVTPSLSAWKEKMRAVIGNLYRATRPGGWLAFEVGEIQGGKTALEQHVAEISLDIGWELHGCVVQSQQFTKTANIWGVSNMRKGTNTQRIVLCRRPK